MKKIKMKKFSLILCGMTAVLAVIGLCACKNGKQNSDSGEEQIVYAVSYAANGGEGTAPLTQSYQAGTQIIVAENTFTKEGFEFAGWETGGTVYLPDMTYTVPDSDTEFRAKWVEANDSLNQTYSVSYDSNGGEGEAPETRRYRAGTLITVSVNTFTYEGHVFRGWRLGDKLYESGAFYTVPEANTVFTAQWEEADTPKPSFTRSAYEYDRIGSGDMELPFDLDGANLFYVKLDGTVLQSSLYYYDEQKQAIVISMEYMLGLEKGEHKIIAVTDSEEGENECTLTVIQSLETSFDGVTEKNFVYGKDEGVTFTVNYNGTTPVRLLQDENVIDEKYYSYDENSLTVSGEWLKNYYNKVSFKIWLSNNDIYEFSINSNVIFATDYDITVIHDTTASNLGLNPLYQYYDAVSVVEGVEGMSGKVLRIKPNTEEVTYDCNSYLTLRTDEWDTLWYAPGFKSGKYYVVSFDYMTEGTSVGELAFKGVDDSIIDEPLLMGAENDGVVRRFVTGFAYSDIGNGVRILAKFIGGSGYVYIDNFKIAEYDALPEMSAIGYNAEGGYELNFDDSGFNYELYIDGNELIAEYDGESGTIIISKAVIDTLTYGAHTVSAVTAAGTYSAEIRVTDDRVAYLTTTVADYNTLTDTEVKIYGSFSDNLTIVSVRQKGRTIDGGYPGDWDFAGQNDTASNYKDNVTFTPGLDGTGYITLPKDFLDKFADGTTFLIEFDNGVLQEVAINSNIVMLTNYDETSLIGNNTHNSPLNSGLWGNSVAAIEEDGDGGKALFIRSTEGAGATACFTVRFHGHPWQWYTVQGKAGEMYRVTFDYCIFNLAQDSVYFYIMSGFGEDRYANFFGGYDQTDPNYGDQYYKMRYNLIADGQTHKFDSGWFTFNADLRMMSIELPSFTVSDNAYFMIDDYRVISSAGDINILANFGGYVKGETQNYAFNSLGQTVKSVTVDGVNAEFTQEEDVVTLSAELFASLDCREYVLIVTTDEGIFRKTVSVTDNRAAVLTETSKNVVYGEETVKLAGTFDDTLKVTSLTRRGYGDWDNSNATGLIYAGSAASLNPDYITVEADGLVIGKGLIDQAYNTNDYIVTFDNGVSAEFSLTSNMFHFTNYDETCIYANIGSNNNVSCQDMQMQSFEDIDGNTMLKYTPSNAVEGHSVAAINGSGTDNRIFTFANKTYSSTNWWDYTLDAGETLVVVFDFKIVASEGKTPDFTFFYGLSDSGEELTLALSEIETDENGLGHFYLEITNPCNISLGCPANNPSEVEGCYMLIDNFGLAKKV